MESLNILLVEDDQEDIELVKKALKDCAHTLYIAASAEEALNMIEGFGAKQIDPLPSMIMIDINLPKMNGFELLVELRKKEELNKALVFMLTGSEAEEDKDKALKANVAGYIRKSITLEKLINAAGWHLSWGFYTAKRTPRVVE